jgi:hypothetical protein
MVAARLRGHDVRQTRSAGRAGKLRGMDAWNVIGDAARA